MPRGGRKTGEHTGKVSGKKKSKARDVSESRDWRRRRSKLENRLAMEIRKSAHREETASASSQRQTTGDQAQERVEDESGPEKGL